MNFTPRELLPRTFIPNFCVFLSSSENHSTFELVTQNEFCIKLGIVCRLCHMIFYKLFPPTHFRIFQDWSSIAIEFKKNFHGQNFCTILNNRKLFLKKFLFHFPFFSTSRIEASLRMFNDNFLYVVSFVSQGKWKLFECGKFSRGKVHQNYFAGKSFEMIRSPLGVEGCGEKV